MKDIIKFRKSWLINPTEQVKPNKTYNRKKDRSEEQDIISEALEELEDDGERRA